MNNSRNHQFTVVSIALLGVLIFGFFMVRAFEPVRSVPLLIGVVLIAVAATAYFSRRR